LLRFGWDKARFSRQIEANVPLMEARFRDFRRPLTELSERQLLDEVDRLYPLAQETAYYNIVTALLMRVYNRLLERQLASMGVDFQGFEMTGGAQYLEDFEPSVHLARLHQEYNYLDGELQARIRSLGYQALATLPGTEALRCGLERFLEQFGHLSDSGSDFSCEPWRDDPDLVLQLIANYTPPEGGSARKFRLEELEVKALRRPFFMAVYRRARRYQWYRELVSSLYTYGYGLFRDQFLELGERFVGSDILRDRHDIFFLYLDEIRDVVEAGGPARDYQALACDRKDDLDRFRDITPPQVIYGKQAPPLPSDVHEGLQGIATSRGHYTGPARILRGLKDFDKLQVGDVLVIPYSDAGWTPLFTKAGAVIAESGGMLSHSSIIAREYGIPAVVSVPSACQIAEETLVTVDGYRGRVILHESMPS
jgi:pyruvate,water dikinase